MTATGIDRISFYTPRYYLPLSALAEARGVDPGKYIKGLGQENMSVPPPDEDTVTMAAAAAQPLLDDEPETRARINLLLLATETGVDQSKAAGLFVHKLLDLPARCRVVEVKQACYSATAALRMACAMVAQSPASAALVIASDIARYDLGSPGEPTQGSGAVALRVTAKPRLLTIEPHAGLHAEDIMDFWRPNYRRDALVDGRYSTRMYLHTAMQAFDHYRETSGLDLADIDRYCYHLPFTRMAAKAHSQLVTHATGAAPRPRELAQATEAALAYNRQTGNTYTAALYEGLACLLDTCPDNLAGRRIGLFSYGSGCTGEFFSGIVTRGYRKRLLTDRHRRLLEDRTELTVQAYEDILNLRVPEDGLAYEFAPYCTGGFRLAGVREHKRCYEVVE